MRAIFADGRLWVLSDAGVLFHVTEDQTDWTEENLPDPVFDLCAKDGHPVVITGKREDAREWTLRYRVDDTWSAVATVETQGDMFLSADCAAESIALLTTRRLIEIDKAAQRSVMLSGDLRLGPISSMYGTSDQLFVGINAGEWGGGLRRIDRRTGKVTAIERNASGELCGGPLNSSCDPVNGITSEPWKPDCIVAVIGLVHFRPRGRIVEVCGDQVERLYYKPYGSEPLSNVDRSDEPFSTVAFFGLTRSGDTLWAVGIDGLYSIEQGVTAHTSPLPRFKEIGNIHVSFDLPNLILVLTTVNQRRSLSGGVPMLVPR